MIEAIGQGLHAEGIGVSIIRTLKEQCVHRHRFKSLQHAGRVIGD